MEDVSVKAEARLALAATWYSNATVRSRSCSCHGDGDAVLPRSHAYLWHHLRAVTTVFKHVNARGNVSGMHICKRGHANRIPKEIATLVELGTIEGEGKWQCGRGSEVDYRLAVGPRWRVETACAEADYEAAEE
jgi:hypothetical protein